MPSFCLIQVGGRPQASRLAASGALEGNGRFGERDDSDRGGCQMLKN